jgi:predicted HicB family RNase H-like nuclease
MKNITLRLPDDLHALVVAAADQDERSLNGEIIWLLRQALERRS